MVSRRALRNVKAFEVRRNLCKDLLSIVVRCDWKLFSVRKPALLFGEKYLIWCIRRFCYLEFKNSGQKQETRERPKLL